MRKKEAFINTNSAETNQTNDSDTPCVTSTVIIDIAFEYGAQTNGLTSTKPNIFRNFVYQFYDNLRIWLASLEIISCPIRNSVSAIPPMTNVMIFIFSFCKAFVFMSVFWNKMMFLKVPWYAIQYRIPVSFLDA